MRKQSTTGKQRLSDSSTAEASAAQGTIDAQRTRSTSALGSGRLGDRANLVDRRNVGVSTLAALGLQDIQTAAESPFALEADQTLDATPREALAHKLDAR
jgi:hypothetical protein